MAELCHASKCPTEIYSERWIYGNGYVWLIQLNQEAVTNTLSRIFTFWFRKSAVHKTYQLNESVDIFLGLKQLLFPNMIIDARQPN
jgi:hypothetical protein